MNFQLVPAKAHTPSTRPNTNTTMTTITNDTTNAFTTTFTTMYTRVFLIFVFLYVLSSYFPRPWPVSLAFASLSPPSFSPLLPPGSRVFSGGLPATHILNTMRH